MLRCQLCQLIKILFVGMAGVGVGGQLEKKEAYVKLYTIKKKSLILDSV